MIEEGLRAIHQVFPAAGEAIRHYQQVPGMVGWERDRDTIRYGRDIDAFRAVGTLMTSPDVIAEQPRFDLQGVMLDVSRDAVLRNDTVEALLVRFALCGINTVMLYSEDTYQVPDQPMFGYLRGAYSFEDLAGFDKFAQALGIEMFPCIETLGHLEQVLQWPVYQGLQDVRGVILVGDPAAQDLLREMIHSATAPFHSRRIHLGLDEAFRLGEGQYRKLHGPTRAFDVFLQHMDFLRGVCHQLGLQPMMWSDMWFRMGSPTGDSYDPASVVPPDIVSKMPPDIQQVYWDYYHTSPDRYELWIDRHRAVGQEPVMATGIWTWNRFWAALPYSQSIVDASMTACKRKNVKQAFVTLWGDDGAECDIWSAMPLIMRYAEHGWQDAVDEQAVRRRFARVGPGNYDAFFQAASIDTIPAPDDPKLFTHNIGKALLWEDPAMSLLSGQFNTSGLANEYEQLSADLDRMVNLATSRRDITTDTGPVHNLPWHLKNFYIENLNTRLDLPATMARVLAAKVDLRRELQAACRARDHGHLEVLATGAVPKLRALAESLWHVHRRIWMATFRPFGWEVIEGRYGALLARLHTIQYRLQELLAGHIDSIPELEVPLQKVYDKLPTDIGWDRAKGPSAIK